ncbi:MAG TPA: glycoside hydrolase family 2 TIM barrel-domain containing protein [Polyangia bacterium]|nr:glycoside hydrolase family 2 TIM barrel-domain containing protein [Polyangia bacterium]
MWRQGSLILLACWVGASCGGGGQGRRQGTGGSGGVVPGTGGSAGAATGGATMGSRGGGSGGASTGTGGSVTGTGGAAGAGGQPAGGRAMGGTGGGTAGAPGTSSGAPAQTYDGQRGVPFNDGWKFHLGDVTGAQQPAFDDSGWRSLRVPHDWSAELPFNKNSPAHGAGGFLDGGVGWYRKTFTADASYAGKKVRIGFDGVYMNSQVWINGTSLGTRPYGYTTFEYDLTPYLKAGASNVIAVRVDNSSQPNSRWYSGSGIYRNVWLTALNPVHVAYEGAFITTPAVSATSAGVSVAADVENQSADAQSVTITAELRDASGAVVASGTSPAASVAAGKTSTLTQSLTVANPHLWSVDAPYLYEVSITVQAGGAAVDTFVVPIGLRSYTFDAAKGFSLNGQSMKLWGTANHHDFGAIGAAYHRRALERELQILKGMGVNALRTSHNPPAPELLDLADQMGFLVMDEAFDVWETGKDGLNDYHLFFKQWAQADLQDLVRRDRNHASVIMWSIGNEIQGASTATAANLMAWVKAVDSTRPVTWACNNMGDSTNQAVAAMLDLQGYNYLQNNSITSPIFDGQHASHAGWKIFGSEMESGGRSRGFYSSATDTPAGGGQCDDSVKECSDYPDTDASPASYEQMYVITMNRPWFAGEFDWTGFDYGGEPWPYSNDAKSSYFGMVDTAGFPKNGYYFWQSKRTSAPMVHIFPHWNWKAGTTVNVWVYSNCDSVELFLNGTSLGAKSFTSSSTASLGWTVPWAAGALVAKGTKGGAVVATDEVDTAGAAAKVGLTVDRDAISADGWDLAYVTAAIQDAAGATVPTASNSVTFAVSGPGKLVGVDNGDPMDFTAYSSPTRKAFSGKALAIVQSTGAPGAITVTATASGLTAGTVSTTAR